MLGDHIKSKNKGEGVAGGSMSDTYYCTYK